MIRPGDQQFERHGSSDPLRGGRVELELIVILAEDVVVLSRIGYAEEAHVGQGYRRVGSFPTDIWRSASPPKDRGSPGPGALFGDGHAGQEAVVGGGRGEPPEAQSPGRR